MQPGTFTTVILNKPLSFSFLWENWVSKLATFYIIYTLPEIWVKMVDARVHNNRNSDKTAIRKCGKCLKFKTRLALTSVLGPFAVYLLEIILHWHPRTLMHYSGLEFHFKVFKNVWRNICTQSQEKLIWSLPCEVWTRNQSHNAKNLHWFPVFQRCRPSWIRFCWSELLGSLKSLDLARIHVCFAGCQGPMMMILVDFHSLTS